MPQGERKNKIKIPETFKSKKKEKGPAVTKRGNIPIIRKKVKNAEVQKIKKMITKTVNSTAEEQLRAIALDGKKSLISKNESLKIGKSKHSK